MAWSNTPSIASEPLNPAMPHLSNAKSVGVTLSSIATKGAADCINTARPLMYSVLSALSCAKSDIATDSGLTSILYTNEPLFLINSIAAGTLGASAVYSMLDCSIIASGSKCLLTTSARSLIRSVANLANSSCRA